MDHPERPPLAPSGLFQVAAVDILQHDRRQAHVRAPVDDAQEAEPVGVRKTRQWAQVARILGDLAEMGASIDFAQPRERSEAAERHYRTPNCWPRSEGTRELHRHDLGLAVARDVPAAFGYPERWAGDRVATAADANSIERAGRYVGHQLSHVRGRANRTVRTLGRLRSGNQDKQGCDPHDGEAPHGSKPTSPRACAQLPASRWRPPNDRTDGNPGRPHRAGSGLPAGSGGDLATAGPASTQA